MAQESCNLDKDEAEILKPSSPPPSQPTTTSINNPPSSGASASLCLKSPQEFSAQKPEKTAAEISCKVKAEKESQPSVQFSNRCSSCKRKALGREEISKANPLVRAAKIIKI
ncbi:uncharacterized protein A4U43_C09F5330 [Asparagus officinalis]|uniref:Uncharacterized protein n=1 Tax=Asparagus officinalis TaxID=4686 RepID=A0A5P1E5I1_ASPOF|nr:uncharacterized protein A4U43_C09F5330 [Asparagus officinalis]